jgi:hypothetical protein
MNCRKPRVCGSFALPVVWLVAAAVFTLMQPPLGPAPLSGQSEVATYLAERHGPIASIGALSLIFAVLYGAMVLARMPLRRSLAWTQSAVLIAGLALILTPAAILRMGSSPPAAPTADTASGMWTWVSTAGLVMASLGLLLFAALVLDLLLRRSRHNAIAA